MRYAPSLPVSLRCTASTTYLAVLLAAVGVISMGEAQASWTGTLADRVISQDDNEYARGVQLILDEVTVGLHAFWAEDAPSVRELHYGQSLDGGVSWSSTTADRVVSFPDGNALYEEPDATLIPEGLIITVWSEDLDGTREVHYGVSTDAGLSFSSETADLILSDPTSTVDTGVPSVTIDSEETIHVVWQQVTGGAAEIHYSRSTDAGTTWSGSSGDRLISFPDGNGAISPQIVVGENDRLIVTWRENGDSGRPAIHLGISDDGGATWTSETADREISQDARIITNLAASALPFYYIDDEVYVVYTATFDESSPFHYEVYTTYSLDNGATWTGETADILVSHDEDHSRSAHNPDVFYSACGGAIVCWDEEDDLSGTNEQHISRGIGGIWSGATGDVIISFPDGENGYRPSITGVLSTAHIPGPGRGVEPTDTWVVWTEFTGGATDNYDVHVSAEALCSGSSVEPGHDDPTLLEVRVFPNPSAGPVRFEMATIAVGGRVELRVFDTAGRSVRRLEGRLDGAGGAVLVWDRRDENGRRLPAGTYHVRARAGTWVQTVPVVLY